MWGIIAPHQTKARSALKRSAAPAVSMANRRGVISQKRAGSSPAAM